MVVSETGLVIGEAPITPESGEIAIDPKKKIPINDVKKSRKAMVKLYYLVVVGGVVVVVPVVVGVVVVDSALTSLALRVA